MYKGAILCVDDEAIILESLEIQLSDVFGKDFLIEFASDAIEALEILDDLIDEKIKILVIISDWLMPDMKGDDFLIEVDKRFPNSTKIMLSGQADTRAIDRAKKTDLYEYIPKPWSSDELINTIKIGMKKCQK